MDNPAPFLYSRVLLTPENGTFAAKASELKHNVPIIQGKSPIIPERTQPPLATRPLVPTIATEAILAAHNAPKYWNPNNNQLASLWKKMTQLVRHMTHDEEEQVHALYHFLNLSKAIAPGKPTSRLVNTNGNHAAAQQHLFRSASNLSPRPHMYLSILVRAIALIRKHVCPATHSETGLVTKAFRKLGASPASNANMSQVAVANPSTIEV